MLCRRIVLLPFVIGILSGFFASLIMKHIKNVKIRLAVFCLFLCLSALSGLLTDKYVFHSFSLNYILIIMAFSTAAANMLPEDILNEPLKLYNPLLSISLIAVIVNLGMPLDYRLIAGAGVFTAIYIISRAVGKVGGAFLGGKLTKAEPAVTKFLGFTLLPHSGVSLVFTGIGVSTLNSIDTSLARLFQARL